MPYFWIHEITSCGWRCATSAIGELTYSSTSQPGHSFSRASVARDFVSAMANSLWLVTTARPLPFEVGDHPVGLRLADLARVLLDVGEQAELLVRAGQRGGVDADDRDVLGVRLADRLLKAGARRPR